MKALNNECTPYIFDQKLMIKFQRACDLTQRYNLTTESQQHMRDEILSQLIGFLGK